jgi:hypothetical protein
MYFETVDPSGNKVRHEHIPEQWLAPLYRQYLANALDEDGWKWSCGQL